jgi:glutathione S-transferase
MDAVDAELDRGGGPYFLGAELSLVECVFAPMLERIAASIPYYKGLAVRGTGCARRSDPPRARSPRRRSM